MIQFLSNLKNLTNEELTFMFNNKDKLLVGKDDKNIGFYADGKVTNIMPKLETGFFEPVGDGFVRGEAITIPTENGEVIAQWG